MENYSFGSNLDHILSKIQIMSHDNRKIIQFTKNNTKFTIIKIESIEDNNLNTIREQNSDDSNDDAELNEASDKQQYDTKIDEDEKAVILKDDDESTGFNQSLKRKKYQNKIKM